MLLALTMISLAYANPPQLNSEQDRLATLLLAMNPKVALSPARQNVGRSFADRRIVPRRSSLPHAIFGGKKKVVVVGACSKTGDFVSRQLSKSFSVTAFCVAEMGRKILDDDGPLSSASVDFIEIDGKIDAQAVVLAFEDPPPVQSVAALLKSFKDAGIGHVVLLSRLGATKGKFGNKWGPIEEAATKAFGEEGLSILRVGGPLEGGPYYKREVDTIKWSSSRVIEGYRNYEVQAGDEIAQGGLGYPRGGAAAGIAALLRRGPEGKLAAYAMTATIDEQTSATTDAQLDAMFNEAGGEVSSASANSVTWDVDLALEDSKIAELTQPQAVAGPNIIDILFNSPPQVSGQYWGVVIIFAYGFYITSTEDYIAKTGVDIWSFLK